LSETAVYKGNTAGTGGAVGGVCVGCILVTPPNIWLILGKKKKKFVQGLMKKEKNLPESSGIGEKENN